MSNWEKTMKEWDDSIPDGIKYLSAENRVLTRKVRELESENAAEARIAELEAFIDQLIEVGEKMFTAVIAAADPYDEGMREWDKIVNDWKEG